MSDWSVIERNILRALAVQVRIVSVEQVARGWFKNSPTPQVEATSALVKLERSGLIRRRHVEAHPIIALSRPLFTWRPSDPNPSHEELEVIAEKSHSRWSEQDHSVEVYFATRKTTHVFGAFGDVRHLKHCETTHDLHLSEVYVRYRRKSPILASNWRGESAFPKLGLELRGMKDPDAFVFDRRANVSRIIEFSGKYSVDHLRSFHQHCSGRAAKQLAGSAKIRSTNPLCRLYASEGTRYELW